MTEAELVQRFCQHEDSAAFGELVDRHRTMVVAECRKNLIGSADLEDAVQETFVKLARHAGNIQGSVGAWLRTVAANTSQDFTRRAARERVRRHHWSAMQGDRVEIVWEAVYQRLQAAIACLDEPTRELITARFFAELPMGAIGKAQGISTPTVSRRVGRALQLLREALQKSGVNDADVASIVDLVPGAESPQQGGLLWEQRQDDAPVNRPLRIGVLASYFATQTADPYGWLQPIERQLTHTTLLSGRPVRLYSLVESDSAGIPVIERSVRTYDLLAGMLDATDADALSILDVIFMGHAFAIPNRVLDAIATAVEGGVGLYNEGFVGLTTPGVNDPRVCRLMLTEQASEFHSPHCRAHDGSLATVVASHPIIAGVPVGKVVLVGGCGMVFRPRPGAKLLIRHNQPVDGQKPPLPSLRQLHVPVLVAGELGRGRVILASDPGFYIPGENLNLRSCIAEALDPFIPGGFLSRAIEWLAEPRR